MKCKVNIMSNIQRTTGTPRRERSQLVEAWRKYHMMGFDKDGLVIVPWTECFYPLKMPALKL